MTTADSSTCPPPSLLLPTDFLKLVMLGVQTHIQSPLPEVRHIGMAVGEVLMNSLQGTTSAAADSDGDHQRLEFEYPTSEATEAIKKLGRPVAKQEQELKQGSRTGREETTAGGRETTAGKGAEESGGVTGGKKGRIGQLEVRLLWAAD